MDHHRDAQPSNDQEMDWRRRARGGRERVLGVLVLLLVVVVSYGGIEVCWAGPYGLF